MYARAGLYGRAWLDVCRYVDGVVSWKVMFGM